ncbi:MAG TPA: DUF3137 domain-containing protein, partial [bacterium]
AQLGWMLERMDHAGFEREFKVYCTDTAEAHGLLTPPILERLAAFKQRMRHGLYLSYTGDSLRAFIESGALFAGDADADLTQFAAYRPYFEQIYVVFDLLESLGVNTGQRPNA